MAREGLRILRSTAQKENSRKQTNFNDNELISDYGCNQCRRKFDKRSKARKLTEFEITDKEFQELMTEHDRFMKAEEICHYTQTRVTEGAGKHKSGET